MKPVTLYLDSCDYDLIQSLSPNSVYFFKKCKILSEQTSMPFEAVALIFNPDRFTRRPMVAMLKDLICAIADGNKNGEVLCALVYKFLLSLE